MIVLAIFSTIIAILLTLAVMFANSMRSSPGEFYGRGRLFVIWVICIVFWLAWWFR